MTEYNKLQKSVQNWITFFIIALIVSGATAFTLETELKWLAGILHVNTGLQEWMTKVYLALKEMNAKYPFLAYGYDWLGFAHIIIAIAFIGPLIDPIKNIWIIQFGIIACIMILPLAFIAGYIRHIPFYWQLIDCSFGVIGLIPLGICYRKTKRLERLMSYNNIIE